jgi:hypothetical protein
MVWQMGTKTTKADAAKILAMLKHGWPGQVDATSAMVEFWTEMLADVPGEVALVATKELCGQGGRFPPPVGLVRQMALKLQRGSVVPPTGIEAWERVQRWYRETPEAGSGDESCSLVVLTQLERRALRSIGGSSQFKFSRSPASDRKNFIEFFDALVEREEAEYRMTPEARQLAGQSDQLNQLVGRVARKMEE